MKALPASTKTRLSRACAGIVLALGIAGPALAATPEDFKILKTQNLYNVCSVDEGGAYYAEARQACYGFIYGAGLMYYEAVKAGAAKSAVCANGELTRETIRQAFVSWADEHPERMDESPIDGLLRSAAAQWPCT